MTTTLPPPPPPPPAPPAPPRQPLKDRYRPDPTIGRRIAAGIVAAGLFVLASSILGIPLAFLAGATIGYCIAEQVPAKLGRTVALALAVWSHGPVAGVESDRCYPARARHFLWYMRTGENPRVVPKLPELVRRCVNCGAPEWCTADPDGAAVNTHDFEDNRG